MLYIYRTSREDIIRQLSCWSPESPVSGHYLCHFSGGGLEGGEGRCYLENLSGGLLRGKKPDPIQCIEESLKLRVCTAFLCLWEKQGEAKSTGMLMG